MSIDELTFSGCRVNWACFVCLRQSGVGSFILSAYFSPNRFVFESVYCRGKLAYTLFFAKVKRKEGDGDGSGCIAMWFFRHGHGDRHVMNFICTSSNIKNEVNVLHVYMFCFSE